MNERYLTILFDGQSYRTRIVPEEEEKIRQTILTWMEETIKVGSISQSVHIGSFYFIMDNKFIGFYFSNVDKEENLRKQFMKNVIKSLRDGESWKDE